MAAIQQSKKARTAAKKRTPTTVTLTRAKLEVLARKAIEQGIKTGRRQAEAEFATKVASNAEAEALWDEIVGNVLDVFATPDGQPSPKKPARRVSKKS